MLRKTTATFDRNSRARLAVCERAGRGVGARPPGPCRHPVVVLGEQLDPRSPALDVHRRYLALYVDAVEWVELPNTLGMSQFADGGIMASKPYAATGGCIDRMSNGCSGCPYDPKERIGANACPFTNLYWGFLLRHRTRLGRDPRPKLQARNAERLAQRERREIRRRADALNARWNRPVLSIWRAPPARPSRAASLGVECSRYREQAQRKPMVARRSSPGAPGGEGPSRPARRRRSDGSGAIPLARCEHVWHHYACENHLDAQ